MENRRRLGRPRACRKISSNIKVNYFKPRGLPLSSLKEVELTKEEVEALRLKNIKNCDFMINIYTEVMPSTVLLEGMILKKPIMNISMVDESYNFEYLKDNAVLNISDKSNLEKNLQTFLTNSSLQEQLVSAATNHVEKFLTNPGTASKIFANMINSIK